jgi:fructoselysine-6-P-deglycase FrlB-like protein
MFVATTMHRRRRRTGRPARLRVLLPDRRRPAKASRLPPARHDLTAPFLLGSGLQYGYMRSQSKMKEMTSPQRPFHFLEFRHGPMSMVNQRAVVVGLVSQSNFDRSRPF